MTAGKLSGVIPKMINTARDELRSAHAARHAAESARDGARQATNRANKEEAEKLAQRWETVEGEARALRIRLGREGDEPTAFAYSFLDDNGIDWTFDNR